MAGEIDRVGGGERPVNCIDSDTADVAKLSSSSFSSTMSSGMSIVGRAVRVVLSSWWWCSMAEEEDEEVVVVVRGASSMRKRRRDSGEMSRERLPSERRLRSSSVR
jgi:hypothetical protein